VVFLGRDKIQTIARVDMRILFLTQCLDVSGVAVHMRLLGRGLQELGCQVAVASCELHGTYDRVWFENAGFGVFQVPFPGKIPCLENLRNVWPAIAELTKVCRRFKPDVLHSQAGTVSPLARYVGRRIGIPVVTTFHTEDINAWKRRIGRLANVFLHRPFGDRCIAVSSEMVNLLSEGIGVPRQTIVRVPHSPDDSYFRPPNSNERVKAKKHLGVSAAEKAICLVGVLSPYKGHHLLVDAIAALSHKGLRVTALCAGKGTRSQKESIMAHANEAGVSNQVRLLGHQDTREVMWASDALVLPSTKDAFGLVVAEGMLCGLVPIRTPSGGARDQIEDGVTGFVVPFDDPEALAQRLWLVLNDDGLRSAMSRAALEFARANFTVERMARGTLSVYQEAAGICARLIPS